MAGLGWERSQTTQSLLGRCLINGHFNQHQVFGSEVVGQLDPEVQRDIYGLCSPIIAGSALSNSKLSCETISCRSKRV